MHNRLHLNTACNCPASIIFSVHIFIVYEYSVTVDVIYVRSATEKPTLLCPYLKRHGSFDYAL